MSRTLMSFAQSFASERITAQIFAESYIELWKIERDLGLLQQDDAGLATCLSGVFCAADMYCDDDADRLPHELDATQLHAAVVAQIDEWKQSEATR
ncbi:MAG: colicin immunity domain-containing protein [Stenotrophomonas sp.]